jgi:hypothetical protein
MRRLIGTCSIIWQLQYDVGALGGAQCACACTGVVSGQSGGLVQHTLQAWLSLFLVRLAGWEHSPSWRVGLHLIGCVQCLQAHSLCAVCLCARIAAVTKSLCRRSRGLQWVFGLASMFPPALVPRTHPHSWVQVVPLVNRGWDVFVKRLSGCSALCCCTRHETLSL